MSKRHARTYIRTPLRSNGLMRKANYRKAHGHEHALQKPRTRVNLSLVGQDLHRSLVSTASLVSNSPLHRQKLFVLSRQALMGSTPTGSSPTIWRICKRILQLSPHLRLVSAYHML